MNPESLKFAKTHEWVAMNGETATIGISDFAVKELTDVVHMELPQVGTKLTAGETMGEIESVKAVSDLYAPLSGEILEVNNDLANDLGKLSEDPFGSAWMVKLKASKPEELANLLSYPQYLEQCESH
jgi:glycine cleavage system H protein